MSIKCAWASLDENGKAKGGKAGDQTGKEVKVGNLYNFGQTITIRAKSASVAKKIAKATEAIAINNLVGYDQNDRTTLYNELQKLNWNYKKLTKKVEVDCSELAAVCANCAGVKVSSGVYSGNIEKVFTATKKFTSIKYSATNLKVGDIIVAPGHHVIIVIGVQK